MNKRRILTRTAAAVAFVMTIPIAASHADNDSKDDSAVDLPAESSTVSVMVPTAEADGTKVVTVHTVSPQARKSTLAKSSTPAKSIKQQRSQAYKIVEEYRAPERMAKAKPAPALGSDSAKASAEKSVVKAEQALKKSDKLTNDKLSRANGRIFFRADNGADYTYIGSAVGSLAKRIVVTAEYYVHGGKGRKWYTNQVFAPSYDNKNRSYGTFHAQYMHTLRDWVDNGDDQTDTANKFKGYASDVAPVTVKDNKQGKHLTDVVDGHKLVTGETSESNATMFGYSSNLNNSESLQICNGNAFTLRHGDKLNVNDTKDCNFGSGSSDDPWLQNYNGVTGTGEVRSVTSLVETEASDPTKYIDNGGLHFDRRVKGLFDLVGSDKRHAPTTGAVHWLRKWATLPIAASPAVSGCSKDPSSGSSVTTSQPSSTDPSSPRPSGSAPSEPGSEGTGGEGRSTDASGSSSSSSVDGLKSPANDSEPFAGTDDKSRNDLTGEQIAPWSRLEQIAPNWLRLYSDLGAEGCYGTRVAVRETDISVEVTTIVDRLPNAPGEYTLELRKASVAVKIDKPISECKVSHLGGIQLH